MSSSRDILLAQLGQLLFPNGRSCASFPIRRVVLSLLRNESRIAEALERQGLTDATLRGLNLEHVSELTDIFELPEYTDFESALDTWVADHAASLDSDAELDFLTEVLAPVLGTK